MLYRVIQHYKRLVTNLTKSLWKIIEWGQRAKGQIKIVAIVELYEKKTIEPTCTLHDRNPSHYIFLYIAVLLIVTIFYL